MGLTTRDAKYDCALNAITRIVILLTSLGYLITKKNKIIITGVISLISIILLYKMQTHHNVIKNKNILKEGFSNPELYTLLKNNYTEPTNTNPIMNVLHI